MNQLPAPEQSYTTELVRKGIHLCSLSIPVIYYFIPKSTALSILLPLTFAFLVVELARFIHPPSGRLFHLLFGWLLRTHERDHEIKRLTGATFVLLSATLCVWIFPKVITVTAFAILIVSDSAAALVGLRYGSRPFLKKTLAGAAAFFISAVIVVLLTPKITSHPTEYAIGIAAALVGAVVESGSTIVDDNLSIPTSIGATMWILYIILLPHLNVYALDIRH